ncbi:MAG: type II toxin-antitoxin system RelE/ParE family toxin [Chloroflexota bacterium]
MASPRDWKYEFYEEANGVVPVAEFLDTLDRKTLARFRWSLDQLRLQNVGARFPLVRHVDGDLWEPREESATNIYRIIYFFFSGRRIILLHGFQKKGQKLPPRELAVARSRFQRFIQREGGQRR